MRRIGMLLLTLLIFAVATAWAQLKPEQICSLLTASDLGAIGAAGPGIPAEMPMSKDPKAETMKMCSWRMPSGGIHVSVGKMPPGMTMDLLMAEVTKPYAKLKAQGWTEQKKDSSNMRCSLLTPPAAQHDSPTTTNCLAVAKGMIVSAATVSKVPLAMDKVQVLLDSAIAHLP
jgi:hypothetical protein